MGLFEIGSRISRIFLRALPTSDTSWKAGWMLICFSVFGPSLRKFKIFRSVGVSSLVGFFSLIGIFSPLNPL